MSNGIKEKRECKRTKVSWQVEYTGFSTSHGLIHEGSKLVDYSQSGACFLTMSEVEIGMQLTLHITLPVRMARPLVFKGIVIRVNEKADVGKLFKEVAVRWRSNSRKSSPSTQPEQSSVHTSSVSH